VKNKEILKKCKGCLSDRRFDSKDTKGRRRKVEGDDMFFGLIDPFVIDLYKIINSKSFRRLSEKTQVFVSPKNPHVRTRLSHTSEVQQFSVLLASALGLNADLCSAIGAGHDIGHTPFGHLGEEEISKLTGAEFRHEKASVIMIEFIERKGCGLNLSYETLQGISFHNSKSADGVLGLLDEYSVVRISDQVNYIFSDIQDAIRYGIIDDRHPLNPLINRFGADSRERTYNVFCAIVAESAEKGKVSFSDSDEARDFHDLRKWMYDNVYLKIDREIHRVALRSAFNFIQSNFPKINTAIALASLVDSEVIRIAMESFYGSIDEISLGLDEISQWIPSKDRNIPLDRFPFSDDEFHRY
jgi:dGTPase